MFLNLRKADTRCLARGHIRAPQLTVVAKRDLAPFPSTEGTNEASDPGNWSERHTLRDPPQRPLDPTPTPTPAENPRSSTPGPFSKQGHQPPPPTSKQTTNPAQSIHQTELGNPERTSLLSSDRSYSKSPSTGCRPLQPASHSLVVAYPDPSGVPTPGVPTPYLARLRLTHPQATPPELNLPYHVADHFAIPSGGYT